MLEETPIEGGAYVCAGGYVMISWFLQHGRMSLVTPYRSGYGN